MENNFLKQAKNRITVKMIRLIKRGQTIDLNNFFELYFYTGGDSLVLIDKKTETEIFAIQTDGKNIFFDEL